MLEEQNVDQVVFREDYIHSLVNSNWMVVGETSAGEYNNYVCVVRYRESGIEISGCGHPTRQEATEQKRRRLLGGGRLGAD